MLNNILFTLLLDVAFKMFTLRIVQLTYFNLTVKSSSVFQLPQFYFMGLIAFKMSY